MKPIICETQDTLIIRSDKYIITYIELLLSFQWPDECQPWYSIVCATFAVHLYFTFKVKMLLCSDTVIVTGVVGSSMKYDINMMCLLKNKYFLCFL